MRTLRIALGSLTALAAASGVACRSEQPAPASSRPRTVPSIQWPAALPLTGRLTTAGAEWLAARASRADSVGVVRGDSAIRLRLWPISDAPTASAHQLCGAVALGRVPRLALDTLALPADSTLPALGRRRLADTVAAGGARDPIGVRWIVPGAQAQYHFEGVTRDGAQRVSFRWPVRSDTTVRLPVGAPDSVIEAALQPSPDSLDALVRRVVASATAAPVAAAGDEQPPRQVDAVPLVSDLPFHVVALPLACPTATFRVPMIARVEQRVRIPVKAGDEVDAFASVEYGAVQVAFEEAGLDTTSARFTSVPRARVVAAADGAVTLRLALQVVSKQQRADQEVLLRLTRRHP